MNSLEKKQIILLPSWVQDVLQRNRLELHAALDFAQLKKLASLEDLAGVLALESELETLTGMKKAWVGSLMWAWSRSAGDDVLLQDALGDCERLSQDQSVRGELRERLFTAEARSARHEKPFIVYDLSPGFSGAVIYPGFFGNTANPALQRALVEAMLKALYVYLPYNEVARSPLFHRYLQLLAQK